MSSPNRFQQQCRTLLLIAMCVLLSSLPGRGLAATAADIAGCIKQHLVGLDGHAAQRLMAGHFQRMHLLDAQGIWQAPELARISEHLLPDDLDNRQLTIFVDLMASYADQNPYLRRFLAQTSRIDLTNLQRQARREGSRIFPDVVTYALALDSLTRAMY